MEHFNKKVALVTGGNSGIGYATAKELRQLGATVIITGRRKEALEKAATAIDAIPLLADQANIQDLEKLSVEVKERYGNLDILFINAGVTGSQAPIEHAGTENFDMVMNINFRGAYFTLSKFVPLLKDGASVIFLSSIVAHTHYPNSSIYQASKAALNSIARTAAAELAPRGIRVNIVSPGPHRTEIMKKSGLDAATLESIHDHLLQSIPLKKMGDPQDIANVVISLCQEHSNFITGAELIVDGGMTL